MGGLQLFNHKETTINPRAIVGVLPLFPDKADMSHNYGILAKTSAYEWINPYTLMRSGLRETGMIVWAREICIDVKCTLQSTLS